MPPKGDITLTHSETSIFMLQLAAAESSARRARKRRSKEDRLDTVGRPAAQPASAGPASLDDTAAMEVELNGAEDEVPHNKENIRETARMNR